MLLLVRRLLFFFICNKTVESNNQSSLNQMLPQTENSLKSSEPINLDKHIQYSADLPQKDCDQVLAFQQQLDILVVDDVLINRKILANILQQQGHNVMEAVNGQDAINVTAYCYQQHQPLDLIFMDIDMPIMDGLTATKYIRQDNNLYQHLIIIAYTDRNHLEQNCYGYFNGYLQKPAKPIEIHSLLFQFTNPSSPLSLFERELSLSPPSQYSRKSQQNNLNNTNNHSLVLGIAI